MDVTVPRALPLVTIPGVELMHAGTWDVSTGTATFTLADFANAVAALDCPAVHRPVIKLGHDEPDPENGVRWDGEPAIGYVANMGTSGHVLSGDLTGMPGWMTAEVLASAYPNRSIEGAWDFRCQLGHTHPFVLTGLALLGVTPPGIGTLQSLQDVAALYGVTAAADDPAQRGVPVTIYASREGPAMPNPKPTEVRAGVTTEDVRRAFYTSDQGRGWGIWITEMQLGPDLQLIVVDDETGSMSRVPITVGDGDGEDAVTFGDPVRVVVRYEDAPTGVAAVAAASARNAVRFASRAESRPDGPPPPADPAADPPAPPPAAASSTDPAGEPDPASTSPAPSTGPDPADGAASTTTPPEPVGADRQEGAAMDAAKIREALGLQPEASDDEVREAITAAGLTTTADPVPDTTATDPATGAGTGAVDDPPPADPAPTPAALPDGIVTIDAATLDALREQAQQGVAARAQQKREDRERAIEDAVRAGKIPPARRDHWAKAWDADEEGTRQTLASLAPGLVPVEDLGAPGTDTDSTTAEDAEFDRLFPPTPAAR